MGVIGVSIGTTFSAAFVLGPLIDSAVGQGSIYRLGAGRRTGPAGAVLPGARPAPSGATNRVDCWAAVAAPQLRVR